MMRGKRRAVAVSLSLSNATASCSSIIARGSYRFFASNSNLSSGKQQQQKYITLMKSSRLYDKDRIAEEIGIAITKRGKRKKEEEMMIKTLYVAPHGSCLLFDSKELLFRYERGEIDDGDLHEEGGGAFLDTTTMNPSFCGDPTVSESKNRKAVGENARGTKNRVGGEQEPQYTFENTENIDNNKNTNNNNATAVFFLNQPATDEGACGLEEGWSEAEKADLSAFVTARAIKPFSGGRSRHKDDIGEEEDVYFGKDIKRGRGGGKEEEGIQFNPKGIVRVVDVGCGTGRFSVMWPWLFPKVEEIILVEPCKHFLDAAVSKFEAEYLIIADEDCIYNEKDDSKATLPFVSSSVAQEGGEGKIEPFFGAPVPTYDFFITSLKRKEEATIIEFASNIPNVCREGGKAGDMAEVNIHVREGEGKGGEKHSNEKEEGPRRIRVTGYQLTVDEYSLIARNATMSVRRGRRGNKENENTCSSETREQQQLRDEGGKEHDGKREGILITTGVAQYLSDAQIIDLAALEDWTLMKEDVSVSTVPKRQVIEALRLASPSLQQEREKELFSCSSMCSVHSTGMCSSSSSSSSPESALPKKECEDSIEFQNARVSYRVPMIADLIAKKMHEVLRTQNKVKQNTMIFTEATAGGEGKEKEVDKVHDEEEIPVALCYASDGGTVRTLQQFEAIFFGKRADKVSEKTKGEVEEKEEISGEQFSVASRGETCTTDQTRKRAVGEDRPTAGHVRSEGAQQERKVKGENEGSEEKALFVGEERTAEVAFELEDADDRERDGNGKRIASSQCQRTAERVQKTTESETSAESSFSWHDGMGRSRSRPFYVYCRDIQWNMPDTFYSPLSTWLLRRRK